MPAWVNDEVVRDYLDSGSKMGALLMEYAEGTKTIAEYVELHQSLVERYSTMRATSEAVESLHGQYSRILGQRRAMKLSTLSIHTMCTEKTVCSQEEYLRFA